MNPQEKKPTRTFQTTLPTPRQKLRPLAINVSDVWPTFAHSGKTDLFIEEPGGGDNEGDVGDHVDHAGPVDGDGGHLVVLLQDGGDDHQLGPLT